jgi:colicin V production protein
MSWFDLGALVVVALAVADGARSGLAWAALESLAVAGTALLARAAHTPAEPYLAKITDLPDGDMHCASHVVVLALLGCAVTGVMILLHPASRRWRFKRDGWFGAALGVLNGLVAALVLFSTMLWWRPRPDAEETLASTRLLAVLRVATDQGLAPLFPEHVPGRLRDFERP